MFGVNSIQWMKVKVYLPFKIFWTRFGLGSGDEPAEGGVVRGSFPAELADVPGVSPPPKPPAKLPHGWHGLEAHEHQRQEHGAHR